MRELKFRAWANGYEKWCHRIEYIDDGLWLGYVDDGVGELSTTDNIVEQYTGIKDKNGKEIYEGDVVKIETFKLPFFVEYHTPSASFLATTKEGLCVEFDDFYAEEDAEVVGNIHENPELCGEEE